MNGKKYLVYLDILGFEALAREIAEKTGFEEDVIRQNYLSDPLAKKIGEIKREGIQISKGISEIEGSDNYVLIVDHVVGLGTKEIDEDIEVKPINRKEIIKFLKNDIINPYRSYYKKKHGVGIKETFVLFTPDFFDVLEPLDRKYGERILYKTKTFFVADVDKVQQRGRVFEFLDKLGYAGSKWYGRIDEVYVPPLEYEDMAETLKEKRIVFITGTPEYGKTYTAVRLMWEYYNKGYEPGWIKGGEAAERVEVRKRLENISAELKPGHIIYFEDPFGRTKYERREGLEREIGTIIDTVKQVEDAYAIITSREEVFKEFEKEKLSAKDLKELVLESIKDEKILPTPLSIKDFAVATFNIEKESVRKEKIKEKSKETAKAFAEEIKNMTDDKILFLSFFNWDNLPGDDNEKLKEFLRDDFDIKWTENAKIRKFHDGKTICILKDEHYAKINIDEKKEEASLKISDGRICYLKFKNENGQLNIYKSDTAAWAVAQTVAEHFTELPESVRNLLDRLQKAFQARIDDLSGKMEDEIELVESDSYGASGNDSMLMQFESYQKLGAIYLISNARSKIDKKFSLDTLGRLSEDWDEEVRTKAKALMNTISGDLNGDKEC